MAKKVLIIEDDEHISKVYELKLAKEGIETAVARDGEEGIAKIVSEKPDLVMLDLMIPRKDGFAVLDEVRKNPAIKDIPIIVFSNLGQKADKDRALSLGAKEYVVKVDLPIQEVIAKVKGYLSA